MTAIDCVVFGETGIDLMVQPVPQDKTLAELRPHHEVDHIRAVTGGTGQYLGATGEVRQTNKGFNTTVFADGSGDNAPNFGFELDLLLPDV